MNILSLCCNAFLEIFYSFSELLDKVNEDNIKELEKQAKLLRDIDQYFQVIYLNLIVLKRLPNTLGC